MSDTTEMGAGGSSFPSTSWSLIQAAQRESSDAQRPTLERLLLIYWKPVYHFIRGSWRKGNEDAKDLTQEFFTVLLEGNYLSRLSEKQGTFRSYIKAALSHFLVSQARSAGAIKREGAHHRVPIDLPALEPLLVDTTLASPEEIFDREWISAAMDAAVRELSKTLAAEKRERCFEIFEIYYLGSKEFSEEKTPVAQERIEPDEKLTYERLARRFGLQPHEIRSNLAYARHKLRGLLEEQARDQATSDGDTEKEIRFLMGD